MGLDRLPSVLLQNILLFVPLHLQLRLVNKEWKEEFCRLHSRDGCKACIAISSVHDLTKRTRHLNWMSRWKLITDRKPSGRREHWQSAAFESFFQLNSQYQAQRNQASLAQICHLDLSALERIFQAPAALSFFHHCHAFAFIKTLLLNEACTPQYLENILSPISVISSQLSSLTLEAASAEHLELIAFSPKTPNLTCLNLKHCPELEDKAMGLFSDPTCVLTNLKSLKIRFCGIGTNGIEHLFKSPALLNLQELCFSTQNTIRIDGSLLRSAAFFTNLTSLKLRLASTEIQKMFSSNSSDKGVTAKLQVLHINDSAIDSEEAADLFQSIHFSNVRCLAFNRTVITTPAVLQILAHSATKNLHSLSIKAEEVIVLRGEDEAVAAQVLPIIASSPSLRNLSLQYCSIQPSRLFDIRTMLRCLNQLSLRGSSQLGAEGAHIIADSTQSLTTLDLGMCFIGNEGIAYLSNSDSMKNLNCLRLDDNELSLEGIVSLASSSKLTALTTLDLSGNTISDDGLIALSLSTNLQRIICLRLNDTKIGPAIVELGKSPCAQCLADLDISYNSRLTEQELVAFSFTSVVRKLKNLNMAGLRVPSETMAMLYSSKALSTLHEIR